MVVASYLAWQLKLEQEEHKTTRGVNDALNEKRLELYKEHFLTLVDLKRSIDDLRVRLDTKRGG